MRVCVRNCKQSETSSVRCRSDARVRGYSCLRVCIYSIGVSETIGLRPTMEDCLGLYWNFYFNPATNAPSPPAADTAATADAAMDPTGAALSLSLCLSPPPSLPPSLCLRARARVCC